MKHLFWIIAAILVVPLDLRSEPGNVDSLWSKSHMERFGKVRSIKDVEPNQEWSSPYGFYPIWFGSDYYIFNSPYVVGGQIVVQWADVSPEKGKYDFTVIDDQLKAYYDKKLYTTIQINGNEHPEWMYDEIPYLDGVRLSQVRDTQGTLMYWYPAYFECYKAMLEAFGNYLEKTKYAKAILGVRYNINALGTEHLNMPAKFNHAGKMIDTRKATSYVYPKSADTRFTEDWTRSHMVDYQKRVFAVFEKNIMPHVRLFLRNNSEKDVLDAAGKYLETGRIALFHTSSEPEPRGVDGELKVRMFTQYARTGKTLAYAEEWADCWGVHGNKKDPHFCLPHQWNYWRLLCDLNSGVSCIAMYGSIWRYVFGEAASSDFDLQGVPEDVVREEIRAGIDFVYRYVGKHNDPQSAPGAFVAFRHSDENLSLKMDPVFYKMFSTSKISDYTGDYNFLAVRLPDSTVGLKLQGPKDQRFGTFARQLNAGTRMSIALHPVFMNSFKTGKVRVNVCYLDRAGASFSVDYGGERQIVKTKGSGRWISIGLEFDACKARNPENLASIIEKGFLASEEELSRLRPDVVVASLEGDMIFHMVEITR